MGELLSSTSSMELAEWMAYEQLEPFGEIRADIRNALLCHVIVQSHGGKAEMKDFLLDHEKFWMEKKTVDADSSFKKLGIILPSSSVSYFNGDAPAIKRIGRRGKPTPAKRRLQELLRGKSR